MNGTDDMEQLAFNKAVAGQLKNAAGPEDPPSKLCLSVFPCLAMPQWNRECPLAYSFPS